MPKKTPRTPNLDGVIITCGHDGCAQELGRFRDDDDHGSIQVWCPKCRRWNAVFNGGIIAAIENEEGSIPAAPQPD